MENHTSPEGVAQEARVVFVIYPGDRGITAIPYTLINNCMRL